MAREIEMENPEVAFLASWIAGFFSDPEGDMAKHVMEVVDKAGVTKDWFGDQRYKNVFEAIDAERRECGVIDSYKVIKRLTGPEGSTVFFDLSEMSGATAVQLEYHINNLKQTVVYRQVHAATHEFMRELTPDNTPIMVESFAAKLRDIQEMLFNGDEELKQLGAFIESSVAKKEMLHQERFVKHNWRYLDGLPCNWDCINQYITGYKTGIHVVAALASAGKSTFAADLSVFWNEQGIRHGFVCIDMADEQLADRYPCIMEQVSLAKLNFGGSRQDVDRFADAYKKAAALNNVWITEADDAKTIEKLAYRGVKTLGWKAMIIDYLQLVSPDEKGQMPEYTKVQKATQAIKRIAKKLKIPIICLAQLSRKAQQDLREKGMTPDLDALGDSAEIARAASTVTMIYRNDDMAKYWAANPPTQLAFGDKDDRCWTYGLVDQKKESPQESVARRTGQMSLAKTLRPMWVDIIKNQQGGKGTLPFVMYPSYFLFRPGDAEGEKREVTVDGKSKNLPVGQFEHLVDDWKFTPQDWIMELTGAIKARGFKLMGETYEQLNARLKDVVKAHPEVKHWVWDEHHATGKLIEVGGKVAGTEDRLEGIDDGMEDLP